MARDKVEPTDNLSDDLNELRSRAKQAQSTSRHLAEAAKHLRSKVRERIDQAKPRDQQDEIESDDKAL